MALFRGCGAAGLLLAHLLELVYIWRTGNASQNIGIVLRVPTCQHLRTHVHTHTDGGTIHIVHIYHDVKNAHTMFPMRSTKSGLTEGSIFLISARV